MRHNPTSHFYPVDLKGPHVWTGWPDPLVPGAGSVARRRLIDSNIEALGRREAVLEDAGGRDSRLR
jgi:hypothetical protein